jgi:hypothetical protein
MALVHFRAIELACAARVNRSPLPEADERQGEGNIEHYMSLSRPRPRHSTVLLSLYCLRPAQASGEEHAGSLSALDTTTVSLDETM